MGAVVQRGAVKAADKLLQNCLQRAEVFGIHRGSELLQAQL
jgi:hypothetical protein